MKTKEKIAVAGIVAAIVFLASYSLFPPLDPKQFPPFDVKQIILALVAALIAYFVVSKQKETENEAGREDPLVCWHEAAQTDFGKSIGMENSSNVNMQEIEIHADKQNEYIFTFTPQIGQDQTTTKIHAVWIDGRKKCPHANRIFAHKIGITDKTTLESYGVGSKRLSIDGAFKIIEEQLQIPRATILAFKAERDKDKDNDDAT